MKATGEEGVRDRGRRYSVCDGDLGFNRNGHVDAKASTSIPNPQSLIPSPESRDSLSGSS